MLNKTAFANAIALVTALFYFIFYLVSLIAPAAFKYLFNAQFLGANVASLMPGISFTNFLGILFTLVIFTWLMGYLWAWFYNWFAK